MERPLTEPPRGVVVKLIASDAPTRIRTRRAQMGLTERVAQWGQHRRGRVHTTRERGVTNPDVTGLERARPLSWSGAGHGPGALSCGCAL